MGLELKPWDILDYLRDELDLADYLEGVLEEDDGPTIYTAAISDAARARGGVRTLAEESDISEAELQTAMAAKEEDVRPIVRKLAQAYRARATARRVA